MNSSKEQMILPKEEGKLSSALLTEYLWNYYLKEQIEEKIFPKQDTDIIKYLLEEELALKINLGLEREKYLNFYHDFAKKTTLLLSNDSGLQIENIKIGWLCYSNYQVLINAFQDNLLKKFCEEPEKWI